MDSAEFESYQNMLDDEDSDQMEQEDGVGELTNE
jgi:hypothetical protein